MIVEKRGESKLFKGLWMCLGEKLEREERKNLPRNYPKLFFFGQNEGSKGIYIENLALRLPAHHVGPSTTLLTLVVLAFSWFNFGYVFEGLPGCRLS